MEGYVAAPMCLGTQGRDGASLEPVKTQEDSVFLAYRYLATQPIMSAHLMLCSSTVIVVLKTIRTR